MDDELSGKSHDPGDPSDTEPGWNARQVWRERILLPRLDRAASPQAPVPQSRLGGTSWLDAIRSKFRRERKLLW